MIAAQAVWLTVICLLGGWWVYHMLAQAGHIAELERAAGIAVTEIEGEWSKTQRMLFWESSTFLVLMLSATLALFWLYWRDFCPGIAGLFASVTRDFGRR